MRENLENLVILFAVVAAIATIGWFGYRSVAGWLGEDAAEVAREERPPVGEPPPSEADETADGEAPAESEPTPPGGIDEQELPLVDEGASAPEPTLAAETETEPSLETGEASLHERVAPSTVIVESAESGRVLGAGWVAGPGLVVTAAAVAERAAGASIRPLDAVSGARIGRVGRIDSSRGLALLEVPDLEAPPLDVDSSAPELGARLHALADGPGGMGFAEGVVTSLRVVAGARAFAMSVAVPGMLEGGPVTGADGRVIGVAIRRLGDEGIEEIVLSSPAVRDLLESPPVPEATPTRPRPRPPATIAAPRPRAEPPPRAAPAPRSQPPAEPREPDLAERRFAPRDYVVESATKLHERPDPSSHVVSRLRPGTVVTAVGESAGWLRVRSSTGGRDGYLPRAAARPRVR